MRHLLAKDLRLLAPYAWIIAPAHVLWCAQAFLVPGLYFWLSLSAACAWTVTLLAIDWRMDADRLLGSLPVTRATVVRARYVGAFAALAVAALLYVVYGHALVAVAGERIVQRWHGTTGWASAGSVSAFLLVGYLLIIGFLPFVFRLGLPLGASWFSVASTFTGSAAAGLWRPGRSSDTTAPGAGTAAQAAGGAAQVWLSATAEALGVMPATVAIVGVAALAGAVSLALSTRFYQAREL